jgi:hypothetical protein
MRQRSRIGKLSIHCRQVLLAHITAPVIRAASNCLAGSRPFATFHSVNTRPSAYCGSPENRGSQVRTGLLAGARWIRSRRMRPLSSRHTSFRTRPNPPLSRTRERHGAPCFARTGEGLVDAVAPRAGISSSSSPLPLRRRIHRGTGNHDRLLRAYPVLC